MVEVNDAVRSLLEALANPSQYAIEGAPRTVLPLLSEISGSLLDYSQSNQGCTTLAKAGAVEILIARLRAGEETPGPIRRSLGLALCHVILEVPSSISVALEEGGGIMCLLEPSLVKEARESTSFYEVP